MKFISPLMYLYEQWSCWRGKHYIGVYTTDIGGFYYCVLCEEVLGHYMIQSERRIEP